MMLVLSILFMNGGAFGIQTMARTMGYENRLFDKTKVHTVDIVMEDWEEFIADAASEEYEAAEIVIDGEAYKNVGLRAKGNTSLSTVASLDSERYSFKIEFDHYDSAKSYYGLDKISLNNLIQDSTMMKGYLSYTMMNEFGVNSPLCSYVYITVNGEDWGLYLAVEGVEEAFLERNYGSDYGELYKPDSMSFGGGRGNGMDFDMEEMDFSKLPEASDQTAMFGGGGENGGFSFGGGMGSSDVKLQYVDDDLDSYSNIWDNAKTDITRTDQERLVESLKKLSHIINGHVPVKLKDGEKPMKAGGKLFIIDGGLSKAYQSTTGIAGYTLIYNSHHLALAEHMPFDPKKESTPKVSVVEKVKTRVMVADTDKGRELKGQIADLKELVAAYREGTIKERVE